MQVPFRKPGQYALVPPDFHITEAKRQTLEKELAQLLTSRPHLIADMQKHASNGDFSENAPYQIAKGQLRGLNRKIDEIQNILDKAEIIPANKDAKVVALGHFVTLKIDSTTKTYQLLGSAETDPSKGIISRNSPIGSVIIGHSVGDIVKIKLAHRTIDCEIVAISSTRD